ncbi:hypothetical protein [Winogradskyella sp. Asnod2-B02-A]|uniref:hypothetical protein n=1 Tax=Winogradskyella sp. Asnod2-B02-A TaxID=3160583 RepID=UPI00386D6629
MKKKIFSLVAVVMFAGSLVSAAPSDKPMEEDFGKASDCVSYWRNAVLTLAANNGHEANTDMVNGNTTYLELYMIAYTECVNN